MPRVRAHGGIPPHACLTHQRSTREKELLLRSVRVSELAPLVGRSDQAQLTWHFRRLVGTTPVATGTADMAKGGTRGVNQSADSCERGE